MIAPSRVREGAGRIGFPLATWEGTKVQPKPAASRMLYLRSAIASAQRRRFPRPLWLQTLPY
jgi:hypothetical protein